MSFELPEYSFLPWSRRGVATQVDQVDHLGANPDAGPKDRATLTASLTVESVPVLGAPTIAPVAVSQSVALVGPGDVKGFRPDSVLRVMPVAGGLTATPGELAYQLRRRRGVTPARIQVALAGLERAGLITLDSRGAACTEPATR